MKFCHHTVTGCPRAEPLRHHLWPFVACLPDYIEGEISEDEGKVKKIPHPHSQSQIPSKART